LPELAAGRWAVLREGMAEKQRELTQRQHDIQTQNNGALEKMLRGVITEKAYSNFDEPTTRELEQIETQLEQLEEQRVTLEELTEQVRAEAIDLAGTWERANFETKLDLQRSPFGRCLYFEPEEHAPV
jgi:hypothetical protein